MAARRNGNSGGNGLPRDHRALAFLAQLVKGQARLAREIISVRTDLNRGFRTLLKVAFDSHRDIQGLKKDVSTLKSDVSDLKIRMTGVENRLDRNGRPPTRPGPNGR